MNNNNNYNNNNNKKNKKELEKELLKAGEEQVGKWGEFLIKLKTHNYQIFIYFLFFILMPYILLGISFFISTNVLNLTELFNTLFGNNLSHHKITNFFNQLYFMYANFVNFGFLFELLPNFNEELKSLHMFEKYVYFLIQNEKEIMSYLFEDIKKYQSNSFLILTLIAQTKLTIISILFYYILPIIIFKYYDKPFWEKQKSYLNKFSEDIYNLYAKLSSEDLKDKKKYEDDLKKLKKEILEYGKTLLKDVEKGNIKKDFFINQLKEPFQIAIDNSDSIFANNIASIANKEVIELITKNQTIKNDEELFDFIYYGTTKRTEEILKLKIDVDLKELLKRKLNTPNDKNLFRKDIFKFLTFHCFLRNIPLVPIYRYLQKSRDINFTTEQKIFLTNSRLICVDYVKSLNKDTYINKILGLSLRISLPLIHQEERKKVITLYSNFLNKNVEDTEILNSKVDSQTLFIKGLSEYEASTKAIFISILTNILKGISKVNKNFTEINEGKIKLVVENKLINEIFDLKNPKIKVSEEEYSGGEMLGIISKISNVNLDLIYILLDEYLKEIQLYSEYDKILPYYKYYFKNLEIGKIIDDNFVELFGEEVKTNML